MRLVLSRVTPEDFDAIIPVQFKSFAGIELADVFFGRVSPKSYAYAKSVFMKAWNEDPADVWLKITDEDAEMDVNILDDEGNVVRSERRKRIVCASNWKIYPTYVDPEIKAKADEASLEARGWKKAVVHVEEKPGFTYLETQQEREDAAVLLEDFLSRRRSACREGHVLCFLLFTDPEYQRKGAGVMMMKWGTDLADQLMLPCWIEASPFGHGLYRKFGYEDIEKVKLQTKSFLSEYTHMRRPCKVTRMIMMEEKRLVQSPINGLFH